MVHIDKNRQIKKSKQTSRLLFCPQFATELFFCIEFIFLIISKTLLNQTYLAELNSVSLVFLSPVNSTKLARRFETCRDHPLKRSINVDILMFLRPFSLIKRI